MRRKLIIVSYRLPHRFNVKAGKLKVTSSSGGLATALYSFFERENIDTAQFSFHWVGVCDLAKKKFAKVSEESFVKDNDLTLHPVFIEGHDSDLFYNGFCNSVLWPLFHYFPSYVVYDQHYFDAFERANKLMTQEVIKIYGPGDIIWIHDYHLMLMPLMLRRELSLASIGFFLHIPFPSFEVFRILPKPWRKGILEGLMGANVVGFHTNDYTKHFIESIERILNLRVDTGIVNVEDREVRIKNFPISIDYEKFERAAFSKVTRKEVKKIRDRFAGSKLILSVDRLDYTKAIVNRLESFDFFLQKYPSYKNKVTYILLLVPTRDSILKYKENKKEVEILISKINGVHGTLNWTPIIYQYRSVDFKKLVSLYGAADVALVVPLRDGMNLVAKEYIASQTESKGVLILSETAGSVNEMIEAISVNPNDRHEIAYSLHLALSQSLDEQRSRLHAMQQHLKQYSVVDWIEEFIECLTSQPAEKE